MAEADCARNVVSMGQIFCNFKAPHGGFSLRHFDDFVKLLENLPGCHTHMHLLWGYSNVLTQMGSWRNPAHWSRNLHRLIYKFGLTLMVEMTMLEVPVLCHNQEVLLPWPILKFSSWLKLIFKRMEGQPVLAGHKLANVDAWQSMFREFWRKYQEAFSGHKVFEQKNKSKLARCLPVLLHGDEGRGKLKRAVMATSVQPLLKARRKKTHGHSFLSRFLYGILPGEKYCSGLGGSFETMQDALVEDLKDLYENGIQAMCCYLHACMYTHSCMQKNISHACAVTQQVTLPDGSSEILYVVLCGVKGDWPYLSISNALGPCMHVSVLHVLVFVLRTVRKMPLAIYRLHLTEKVPLLQQFGISHAFMCCRFGCVHAWPCWPSIVCPGLVQHENYSTMEIWTTFRWKSCPRPSTSHAYTSRRGGMREPSWPNAYMAPWYWTRICGF